MAATMNKRVSLVVNNQDEGSRHSGIDSLKTPSQSGPIYGRTWGIFSRWARFYAELSNHVIYVSLMKGGMVKKSFKLHANTICEDNPARAFCFLLRTPNTKETLILAADNIATKESWIESIQASLSLLRIVDRKLRDKDKKKVHDEAVNEFITRPIIYMKVIRARDLEAKDANGLSDPYVKITLGSGSVRTTTRKKNLNPDWGMVFSFDWDMSMRYAVVEVWDEDFSSADDFLGVVYIPVFSFYDGYTSKAWYPLGKRSHKSTVSGEIEIEISCSGQPDSDLLAWQFFSEVQRLPEFSINLVAQEDGSSQIALKNVFVRAEPILNNTDHTPRPSVENTRPTIDSLNEPPSSDNGASVNTVTEYASNGFPLFYPSIELEILEDISLNCELMVMINNKKLFNDGALLLTSHRLIFISLRRILLERNIDHGTNLRDTINSLMGLNINHNEEARFDNTDLSVQIHLSSISSVLLTSEGDGNDASISYDAVKLKTSDCRTFTFLFKDDCVTNMLPNAGNIFNKAIDHIFGTSNEISLKRRPTNTGLEQTLLAVSPKTTLSPFYEGDVNLTGKNVSTDANANNRRKISVLQSYNHSAENSVAVLSQYGNLSQLEVAWLNIVRGNQAQSIEAAEAPEGPPAHRIVSRIKNKSFNRGIERYRLLIEHYELLNNTRTACGLGGIPPPSMYDLEIRLSEKQNEFANTILLNGIPRSVSEFGDSERPSLASNNPNGSQSLAGNGIIQNNSESGSLNQNDLRSSNNPAQLPLGWTNAVSEDNTQITSIGSQKRRKSSLSELVKRLRRSEGIKSNFTKLLFNLENAWKIYDAAVEFRRIGVPNEKWRISHSNFQYELCSSYPSILAVPASTDDDILTRAAVFRSKNRIPTLSWLHARTGASISRASQPLAGLTNNRSAEDEKLVSEINRCVTPIAYGSTLSTNHFIIIDARPLLNAKAQQAVGKGVENDKNYENTSILFMDIPNIHAVRKSLEMVEDAIYDEVNFLRNLEASQWQVYLYRILIAVNRIVHCVHREGISILVHCSDGWDRTSQLTSLSMLLLDDYYRTLDGFIVLIEKEWISFGHKFADRLGWTQEGWKDEERSPVFFQFLNCVYEYIHQLPNAFEFNAHLLTFLSEHISSGLFGNFFFNNEFELKESQPWHYSISIWSAVLANRSSFMNPSYQRQEAAITPVVTRGRIVFWEEWFFRWHDRLWLNSWIYWNDTEIKKKKDDIIWAEDHAAAICCKCNLKFTMFRRRHHCRCCGLIFCDPCTRDARIIPAISRWRAVRCCEECAEAIDLTQAEINAARRTTRKSGGSGFASRTAGSD